MNARILLSPLLVVATLAVAQTPTTTPPPAALPDAPSASVAQVPAAPTPTGPTVVIDTSMGRLVCKTFVKESPNTVANFIGLVEGSKAWTDPVSQQKVTGKSYYEGTTFHRVIPGFMIQGGDRNGDGTGDAGFFIDNEDTPGLIFDVPGRLAMANAGRNTNGTQFFITEQAVPQLNGGYTIFGQCDDHTVLQVATIARVSRNDADKPHTPVTINKITIVREGQPMPAAPPLPPPAAPEAQPPAGDSTGAPPPQ